MFKPRNGPERPYSLLGRWSNNLKFELWAWRKVIPVVILVVLPLLLFPGQGCRIISYWRWLAAAAARYSTSITRQGQGKTKISVSRRIEFEWWWSWRPKSKTMFRPPKWPIKAILERKIRIWPRRNSRSPFQGNILPFTPNWMQWWYW